MSFFSDFGFGDVLGLVGSGIEAGGNYFAARAQESAADKANALAARIYADQRQDLQPYRTTGRQALNQLRNIYLRGSVPYTASPGYNFRLSEGTKALERGAAARGNQFSGRQAKALTRFGQNVAADDFDRNFNRLAAISGIGQTAVNSGNQAAAQYGAAAGNALYNAGDARASGYTGIGSALTGGINNQLFLNALRG